MDVSGKQEAVGKQAEAGGNGCGVFESQIEKFHGAVCPCNFPRSCRIPRNKRERTHGLARNIQDMTLMEYKLK